MVDAPEAEYHGKLLPLRRSHTNAQYRASDMPRMLGRFGCETKTNPERCAFKPSPRVNAPELGRWPVKKKPGPESYSRGTRLFDKVRHLRTIELADFALHSTECCHS